MEKMWAGRAQQKTAKIADDFNSSIRFDCRLFRQDITGSMAHAAMLARCGILKETESQAIAAALADILADLESGAACRPDRVESTIARAVDLKRRIVEEDETEQGRRKLLNFGHTVGHALEACYRYEKWLHGAAVAIGCAAVTRASERRGLTEKGTAARLEALLRAYRLPITDPAPASEWLPLIAHDKKRRGDDIDLVVLKRIGEAALHTLPAEELAAFLEGTL